MSVAPVLVIAHKARSGPEPENSVEAAEATVSRGIDAIEIDVRRTFDGVLAVVHDARIDGLEVASTPFEELREVRPSLATLPEMLMAAGKGTLVDVDVKASGYEAELLDTLAEWGGRCVVSSFEDEVLSLVRSLRVSMCTGLLLGMNEPEHPFRTRISEVFPDSRLRVTGADIVMPHYRFFALGVLGRARRAGVPVWTWTVNGKRLLRRVIWESRVEGVITDEPILARSVAASFGRLR